MTDKIISLEERRLLNQVDQRKKEIETNYEQLHAMWAELADTVPRMGMYELYGVAQAFQSMYDMVEPETGRHVQWEFFVDPLLGEGFKQACVAQFGFSDTCTPATLLVMKSSLCSFLNKGPVEDRPFFGVCVYKECDIDGPTDVTKGYEVLVAGMFEYPKANHCQLANVPISVAKWFDDQGYRLFKWQTGGPDGKGIAEVYLRHKDHPGVVKVWMDFGVIYEQSEALDKWAKENPACD